MAGKVLRELLGREDYWLVGKGAAVPVGREHLATEELGYGMEEGEVADTVGYMLAGMDQQEVVDTGWGEDKLGFAGSGRRASLAAWASHRVAGGMGRYMGQLAGRGPFAHI